MLFLLQEIDLFDKYNWLYCRRILSNYGVIHLSYSIILFMNEYINKFYKIQISKLTVFIEMSISKYVYLNLKHYLNKINRKILILLLNWQILYITALIVKDYEVVFLSIFLTQCAQVYFFMFGNTFFILAIFVFCTICYCIGVVIVLLSTYFLFTFFGMKLVIMWWRIKSLF